MTALDLIKWLAIAFASLGAGLFLAAVLTTRDRARRRHADDAARAEAWSDMPYDPDRRAPRRHPF